MQTAVSGSLAEKRIAILGLGLMGGSLALALHGRCAELLGIDIDPAALKLAQNRGIVDRAAAEPVPLLGEADLVILAAPVNAIIQLLQDLPRLHPGHAVVIDLGSTKLQIITAMLALPDRFDPIGGHPMCGKEKSGLENADAHLYQGAPFALTALPCTSEGARACALELVNLLGAKPLWLDPRTHDEWVAATSHLPYLAANALAFSTPSSAAPLAGPGFKSTTRLALSSPGIMLDILKTNRENILTALRHYRAHLERLEDLLTEEDFTTLDDLLNQGADQRRAIDALQKGALS